MVVAVMVILGVFHFAGMIVVVVGFLGSVAVVVVAFFVVLSMVGMVVPMIVVIPVVVFLVIIMVSRVIAFMSMIIVVIADLNWINSSRRNDHRALIAGCLDQPVHPAFKTKAIDENDVSTGDSAGVRWCRLVNM
jgi:hypothetical protein